MRGLRVPRASGRTVPFCLGLAAFGIAALASAHCGLSEESTGGRGGGKVATGPSGTTTSATSGNAAGTGATTGPAPTTATGSGGAAGRGPATGAAGMGPGGAGPGGSTGTGGGPVTGPPDVQVFEADACHDLDIAVSHDFVATATNSGHVV